MDGAKRFGISKPMTTDSRQYLQTTLVVRLVQSVSVSARVFIGKLSNEMTFDLDIWQGGST